MGHSLISSLPKAGFCNLLYVLEDNSLPVSNVAASWVRYDDNNIMFASTTIADLPLVGDHALELFV